MKFSVGVNKESILESTVMCPSVCALSRICSTQALITKSSVVSTDTAGGWGKNSEGIAQNFKSIFDGPSSTAEAIIVGTLHLVHS